MWTEVTIIFSHCDNVSQNKIFVMELLNSHFSVHLQLKTMNCELKPYIKWSMCWEQYTYLRYTHFANLETFRFLSRCCTYVTISTSMIIYCIFWIILKLGPCRTSKLRLKLEISWCLMSKIFRKHIVELNNARFTTFSTNF